MIMDKDLEHGPRNSLRVLHTQLGRGATLSPQKEKTFIMKVKIYHV